MGNRLKASMEGVKTYHLMLDITNHLDLSKTFYVPSISNNLISLFKLDVARKSFHFGNGCLVCLCID